MSIINLDDENRPPRQLYLDGLQPEFVRPADIYRLQFRIEGLRAALESIVRFGEGNPNMIFIQAEHAALIEIARNGLAQDDEKEKSQWKHS